MKLIADSGSTKCDWMMVEGDDLRIAKTVGFNPFFHNKEFVINHILDNDELCSFRDSIDEIYYYGAGCSSAARNQIICDALSTVFTSARKIVVAEDLDAAAFATCKDTEGIVCILGTGSNSCYFDGTKIHTPVPALGYVFGDEGSGAYFGKIVLSKFLYNELPQKLSDGLKMEFGLDKETILKSIYNKPHANVYLASFMKFVSSHRDSLFVKEMIYSGLTEFAKFHILCYPNYKDLPVHFVGSIAYYFDEQLQKVATDLGFTIGQIIKKPIESLAKFHDSNVIEA
jgi:glucosamine kinase